MGNIVGDEDLTIREPVYRTTVKCSSLTACVWVMKKEDFVRLENQTLSWQAIVANAKSKTDMITKRLSLKQEV
jgi:hypothetical protein